MTSANPVMRVPQHVCFRQRQQDGVQEEDEQRGSFQAVTERGGKDMRLGGKVGTSSCSALGAMIESAFYF